MKRNFLKVFLLLTLLSSIGFTESIYAESGAPYPDERLDLFRIAQDSIKFKTILTDNPAGLSNFIPDGYIFQHPHSGTLSLKRLASEPVLAGFCVLLILFILHIISSLLLLSEESRTNRYLSTFKPCIC